MRIDTHGAAQAVARRLLRALGETPHRGGDVPSDVESRILDAAATRFAERGVTATTMSLLARDAGISREWLYQHYRGRDAVVKALIAREAHTVAAGLAAHVADAPDRTEAVVAAFTYGVGVIRDDPVWRRVVEAEPETVGTGLRVYGPVVLAEGVDATAELLRALGVDDDRAGLAAATLVRLALALALLPDDEAVTPGGLEAYARAVVTALLGEV